MSRPATVAEPILDGQGLLFKRPDSVLYQVRFKIGRRWVVRSTGERVRSAALEKAQEMFFEFKYRDKLGLPTLTKTFRSLADVVLKDLRAEAEAAEKKSTAGLYAGFLDRFLIPFFGNHAITSIDTAMLRAFDKWRTELLGKPVKAITAKQHNVALGLVFTKAVEQKIILRSEVPELLTTGEATESRPSFTLEEYRVLYRGMRKWIRTAETRIQREKRELMRDMVLVIANTGIRPMNEVDSIIWGGVKAFDQDKKKYLSIHVDGKTGRRTLVARPAVENFIARIRSRAQYEITDQTAVFLMPNGKRLNGPAVLFKELLEYTGLLNEPATGAERTMYSLRHFYATMALIHHRVPIHTLARQMGTSVVMLERHYSKLAPMMAASQLV